MCIVQQGGEANAGALALLAVTAARSHGTRAVTVTRQCWRLSRLLKFKFTQVGVCCRRGRGRGGTDSGETPTVAVRVTVESDPDSDG